MKTTEEKTVAEMVTENYRTADVFKRHGIDFCCGGKVSIKEICSKKNIPVELLEKELLELDKKVDFTRDFNQWDLDFLADYIINTHHKYVEQSIPVIKQYADKVAKVHGDHNPENIQIRDLFYQVAEELTHHMHKEEMILFPYIKSLVVAHKGNIALEPSPFGTVQNPIRMMEMEHEAAGSLLREIARLSGEYTPPEYACNTYRVLYSKLKEFEDDLHQHVHLENNILFPKAVLMESK